MVNVNIPVLGYSWLPYDLTRTQFRRQANAADNKAATVAVDSLLNYEAVKVCLQLLSRRGSETNSDAMQRISTMSTTRLNSMTLTYAHTKRRLSKLPHHSLFSTLVKMLFFQRRLPESCSSLRKESLMVSQRCIFAYNAYHDPD